MTPRIFEAAFEAMRAAYRREVERLADELQPRFLADEFVGWEDENGGVQNGAPRYMRIENELARRHPWFRTAASAIAVMACSPHSTAPHNDVEITTAPCTRGSGAECLATDVLMLAAERGWIRRVHRPGSVGSTWVSPAGRPRAA